MIALSVDAIDRELVSRTAEVDAMSATLIELESHPGLEHIRRYQPEGQTAQRWVVIEQALAQLWEDLGRMTSILDSARTLRARRSKLDDADRAELTRLLCERPLEVSRERIPLAQRSITGPGETVVHIGLAETADRMRATYPVVPEFFDAIDHIDSLIAHGLAPSQQRLDKAGLAGPPEIAELLQVAATDPLSLTSDDVDERLLAIADSIERRSAELAELSSLQANWPHALAATAQQLDALREAMAHAAQTRVRAEQTVLAGPIPVAADPEPGLRTALQSITARAVNKPDPAALRSLRLRIQEALRVVREHDELAQGLLDRRSELKGRLSAYQAKAARLGLGEDPDLLASNRIASGLLSRQPCDLRAVTRAMTDYQEILVEKQGKTR